MPRRYWLIGAVSPVLGLLLLTRAGSGQEPPELDTLAEDPFLEESPPAELAQYTTLVERPQFQRAWAALSRRAVRLGYVPRGARQRGFREKGAHPPAVGHWENIGPDPNIGNQIRLADALSLVPRPTAGRTIAIAVNPKNNRNWLVGAAQGGLWETPNSGVTWKPRTDGEISQAIGAVVFAPSNPQVVYAGTGEGSFSADSYGGHGLLKSTNGGATWTLLGQESFDGNAITAIRVHPGNPAVVLVSVVDAVFGKQADLPPGPPPSGIFKSVDGGLTWTLKRAGFASDIETDPTSFSRQYAGMGYLVPDPANGIYRSLDGGETWSLVPGPWSAPPLSTRGVGRVEIAIAPSNPNVAYVSIQDAYDAPAQATDGALLGLFKTTNAWAPVPTWTALSMGAADNNSGLGHCGRDPLFGNAARVCSYAHDIIVDPGNADTIYAGGVALWKFDGTTWTEVSQRTTNPAGAIHVDQHAFAWAGSRLIVANDGGVWSTTDAGSTWKDHNTGLSTFQFYDGSIHSTNPYFALGGSQDNGMSVWKGGKEWKMFYGADGTDSAISSSQPDTHWGFATQLLVPRRTRDGGATAIQATRGLIRIGSPFLSRLEQCPGNENVFVTGGLIVQRTNEFYTAPDAPPPGQIVGGPLWAVNRNGFLPANITAIAFFPGETTCQTYVVGGFDGGLRYTLGGGIPNPWYLPDFQNRVPNRPVADLAFHPTDRNILYVALSGFDEATPGQPGHLFRATDAVTSDDPNWTDVGPPVNVPFNSIAVDPANPRRLFLGTDVGVFVSTDAGETWAQFSPQSGLPNVAVFDVQINAATNRVVAFTHGRGAFVYKTEAAFGN